MRTRAAAIGAGAVLRPLEEILELLHKLLLLLLLVHRFKSMKRRHPDKVTLGEAAAASLGRANADLTPLDSSWRALSVSRGLLDP